MFHHVGSHFKKTENENEKENDIPLKLIKEN